MNAENPSKGVRPELPRVAAAIRLLQDPKPVGRRERVSSSPGSGGRQLIALPLGRRRSAGQILDRDSETATQSLARLCNALEKFGVVLDAIVKPCLLILKPDEDSSRAPVTRDHDLLPARQS